VHTDGGILETFGSRLREERLRVELSQEDLANRSGLDRTYISDIERGARNIGLKNADLLSRALDLQITDLLKGPPVSPANTPEYSFNPNFYTSSGFAVRGIDVAAAVTRSDQVLSALPISLFTTIDLKSQSGLIGAVFAAELASEVEAIPNPIEKGHPDIVPKEAEHASEAELRNYPSGLEIKTTLGGVAKGSNLKAGESRIDALTGITWQAHHRDVHSLMGLVWDFVRPRGQEELAHPIISAVFFTASLTREDWGEISGTTGRNTKVTGMRVSGRQKMGRGAIVVLDEERYRNKYSLHVGGASFLDLTARIT
jgi:transcriptional regulator with XRE-family HTH domain